MLFLASFSTMIEDSIGLLADWPTVQSLLIDGLFYRTTKGMMDLPKEKPKNKRHIRHISPDHTESLTSRPKFCPASSKDRRQPCVRLWLFLTEQTISEKAKTKTRLVGSLSDRYGQWWCHVKVIFGLGNAKE